MNTKTVWIVVLIIVVAVGGWFVFGSKGEQATEGTATTTATTTDATAATLLGNGVQVKTTGNAKINLVSDTGAQLQTPSLSHETAFAENVPTEVRLKITQQIAGLIAMLKKDKTDFNAWMNLGIAYKVAGDMKQAEAIWLFVTEAAPTQGISAHNLGTFYHLTTKDFPKAERYFRLAIAREPQQEINYLSFHELYRYSYKKDTTAAVDILKDGIRALPESIDLHLALATYYREDKKDTASAISELKTARDLAVTKKNTALVEQLGKQIADLEGQQ